MNYTLKVLRNKIPYNSLGEAKAALDAYASHEFGQPLVVGYWEDDKVKLIFAVGTQTGTGEDSYQIINDSIDMDLNMYWKKGVDQITSTDIFSVGYLQASEWKELSGTADEYTVYFIRMNSKQGRIYKGKELFGTTVLSDINGSIKVNGKTYSGQLDEIIPEAIESIRQDVSYEDKQYGKGTLLGNIKVDDKTYPVYAPISSSAYEPNGKGGSSITIGGIPSGLSQEKLEGKSFSELFDMLLFPAFIPQYTGAKASISISPDISIAEVYSSVPTYTISSSSAYCETPLGKVYGGKGTYTAPSTVSFNTRGTKTWKTSVIFADGVDGVVDSKGDACPYAATNNTTMRTVAEVNPSKYNMYTKAAGTNKWVVRGESVDVKRSVEVVWPYFRYNESGNYEKVPLTAASSFEFDYNAKKGKKGVSIQVPSSFVDVKLIPADWQGNFSESNAIQSSEIVTTTLQRDINGHYESYTQYVYIPFDGNQLGDNKYRITFTIK